MAGVVPSQRAIDLRARYRRVWWGGVLASILLHLLVFLAFRGEHALPPSPFAAAGPRAGDDRAAAGGGGLEAVTLRISAPPPAPTASVPPEPTVLVLKPDPVPEPPVVPTPELPKKPVPEAPRAAGVESQAGVVGGGTGAGEGSGSGAGAGAGVAGGTGRGDGGGDLEGRFRGVPPAPRGLILPPADRPGKVRGKEVEVWVFVTAGGAVVADSTRLFPSSGDSKFDERLKKQAAQWMFQPARKEGRAVAEWFRYVLTL